jgi:hypothetical protein
VFFPITQSSKAYLKKKVMLLKVRLDLLKNWSESSVKEEMKNPVQDLRNIIAEAVCNF